MIKRFITSMIMFGSIAMATSTPTQTPTMQTKELSTKELIKQNRQIVSLAATELSKTLPQTVDKYTILAQIVAEDTTLKYIFEINTGAKSDETVQKEDRTRMKKAITNGICRSSKRFLDAQITISYQYLSAASKKELFEFEVKQADCPY